MPKVHFPWRVYADYWVALRSLKVLAVYPAASSKSWQKKYPVRGTYSFLFIRYCFLTLLPLSLTSRVLS